LNILQNEIGCGEADELMPKAVALGAARPKPPPPPRKTKRVKLEFGEEIRAVDLPLPLDLQEVVGQVREEFSTNNLDIRYNPSTVYRVEVSIFSARHLPKADREGLCDAFVRAEVTPNEVYKFTGFNTTAPRGKTRVVNKSLNPDFDEALTLLVDGTADHTKHGRPRLLVTVSDWDKGEEEMIGQLDLDLADMIATSARCMVWKRQEQVLRDKLKDMQTQTSTLPPMLQEAKEQGVARSIEYLTRLRTDTLAAIENMWLDLDWVPGCIPTTRQEQPTDGLLRVRGADYKLAKLHMGVKVLMTDYQSNCWLNR
jgi:hypothetical protein